jgi:hypothetical protein
MGTELKLDGLDGSNPLAFLAALGVLRALADTDTNPPARIRWSNDGRWRPVLLGVGSRDELVSRLVQDLGGWATDPSLDLHYEKKDGGKVAHDLKPCPKRFREYLTHLLEFRRPEKQRSLEYAGAFATETVTDNNGNVKPTALHFTAGQQEFLAMVEQLITGAKGIPGVTAEDFHEALWGPWRYERPLPVLGWDATTSRDYALRASDPSKDKKLGVPGADWLAFRALALLPVAPKGDRIRTPGCGGGWKSGYFQWPLWTVPIAVDTIRSLLGRGDLEQMPSPERSAIGIGIVFRSDIRRSDQGGYGSFAPAQVM